jgi:enhanced entry protein EnhC
MKSIAPWFCLAAMTNLNIAFANEGLDAYRLGDYNKAANILVKSNSKDPIIDFYMARMRLYGYGTIKNNKTAIRHFELAAKHGLLSAQKIMARYELLETGDLKKALFWFKKAAAQDDTSALMYCASAYFYGVGVKQNRDTARRYYIPAAKNGNSIAQYSIARNFLKTRHASNKKLGMIWLNKALKQHNPEAELLMAQQYISGSMVKKDLVKARELIELAIAQRYLPAYYQMGRLDHIEEKYDEAKKWYLKAAAGEYIPAIMALSKIHTNEKSPLFNEHEGYLWMLKAAQAGSKKACLALSKMYQDGIGTDENEHLAKIWNKKSKYSAKHSAKRARMEAVQWLTDRKSTKFSDTRYDLRGILSPWHNSQSLKQNNYNQPPQMETITRKSLYTPQFVLVDPNDVPISEYYDILVSAKKDSSDAKWQPPHYLVPLVDKLTKENRVQRDLQYQSLGFDYLMQVAMSSDSEVDYEEVFDKLDAQAVIGDTSAQFDIGQMYQHGIGVKKDIEEAIKYYQLAAAQENLPSEYNLGMIYLLGDDGVEPDYKLALKWLNDAAFKGNDFAEYVLARIYEHGYKNSEGKEVIAPDYDHAMAMYNIAAANNYGLAQYRLAEIMVHEKPADISLKGKNKRTKVIKELYQKALANNVKKASLPLAFYNAMDSDKDKQQLAYDAVDKDAEAGNKDAALLLGLMYDRGIIVPKNKSTALRWYKQSGDNPVSAFILGTYTAGGLGLSKNFVEAEQLLQKAVDRDFSYANLNMAVLKKQQNVEFLPNLSEALEEGNSIAGLLLADYYLSKSKDKQQLKEAHKIYKQFSEKGDLEAQLKLAYLYEYGIGGAIDYKQAAKWYKKSAKQGESQAQYLLARLYQLGKITKKPDYEKAKKWYKRAQKKYSPAAVALGFIYDTEDENYYLARMNYKSAANKGNIIGAFNLGLLYERGEGCAVDYVRARDLYFQAAKKGHSQAMVQLGGLFLNGNGGSSDVKEAFKWYQKAAGLGDRDAMYQLGLMYETGVATKLDYTKAKQYYEKAAELGNEKANLALARLHQHGIGGSKDISKSVEIYKTLASHGNAYADYQMALFCFKGELNKCSQAQGMKWLLSSQKNGNKEAGSMLEWVRAKTKPMVSFVQPIRFSSRLVIYDDLSQDLMYIDALNAWNVGDESYSKAILSGLLVRHPNNSLAKETYKQLISINSLKSVINKNHEFILKLAVTNY